MIKVQGMEIVGKRFLKRGHSFVFRMVFSYMQRKLVKHLAFFIGSEHIPKKGAVLITPNHQSYFDGIVITTLFWCLTGRKVRIPTNVKAFTGWFTNFWQSACGAVPIDPASPDEAYDKISDLLHQGEAVVIYPEGTRSNGRALLPFKYGAFNLATELNMPILPVAIRNFTDVLPKGSSQFQRNKSGSIVFGELIDPSSYVLAFENKKLAAQKLRKDVRTWIEDMVHSEFAPIGSRDSIDAEVSSLAIRADIELEELLDQGANFISRQDAKRVMKIISLREILGANSFDLDIQFLRAYGFWVAALPIHRVLLALGRYRRYLNEALCKDEEHAYLNYCMGQIHLKAPKFLGGGDMSAAVDYFGRSYRNAEEYGYPAERFVFGYASALAKAGEVGKALCLLNQHFGGSKNVGGIRRLRRRERAMALIGRLNQVDKEARSLPSRGVRGFELVMAQARISDVIVGQVDKEIDFRKIVDAAAALQRRHPGLRARVVWRNGRDRRPFFEYQPADADRLNVREEYSSAKNQSEIDFFWEEVAEKEVNHLFDLSEGYMFRVVWLPQTKHIILNVQHSLVDGVSLMRLLNEFLRCCAGEDLGLDLPPTNAALSQGPSINFVEKTVGRIQRDLFMRARKRFHKWTPLPINSRLEKGQQLSTHCYFSEGDKEKWCLIKDTCRSKGVTVGGAYAAAIQCALLYFSKSSLGPREKYYLSMDFSLRRLIPGGDNTQEALGLFSGNTAVVVKGNPEKSYWDLARDFMESSKSQMKMKAPLIFHEVFDGFWNLEASFQKYGFHCVESGGSGGVTSMSNVGQYPYKARTGDIELESIYGMSASQKGGAMLYFWLRSINGQFFYNATSTYPSCDRAFAREFFLLVVYFMENCSSQSATELSIKEYIPETAGKFLAQKRRRDADNRMPMSVV